MAEFLQRKVEKAMRAGNGFPSHKSARGVNTVKVENIVKVLCPHMEPVKRQFWFYMPQNDNSPDLQVEHDPNED